MTKYYLKNEDGTFTEVKALSQEEVDTVVQDRLKRQAEKYSDYEDLKSKVNSIEELTNKHKAEVDGLQKKLSAAETEVKLAKLATAKEKALRDFNIKDSLADFVTGDDEEELRARAERLSHELPSNRLSFDKESTNKNTGSDSSVSVLAKKLLGDGE